MITQQYDAFAEVYDRYFSDKLHTLLSGKGKNLDLLKPSWKIIDEALKPSARILDCACGPGHLVLALSKRGYKAYGADVSSEMIRIARGHSRKNKLKSRFVVADFTQLPQKLSERFDLVLCVGNAIGHCRGIKEMMKALKGMYEMLKPGASLYMDTRCWETYHKLHTRYDAFSTKSINGERWSWLNARHYPKRFSDPHLIEVVITRESKDERTVQVFPITYYPFRLRELRACMKAVGFDEFDTTYKDGCHWYHVTATRPK